MVKEMSSFGDEKNVKENLFKRARENIDMTKVDRNLLLSMFNDGYGTTYRVETGCAIIEGYDPIIVYPIVDCTLNTLAGILLVDYYVSEEQKTALIFSEKAFVTDKGHLYTVQIEGESPELLAHFLKPFSFDDETTGVILKLSVRAKTTFFNAFSHE